MTGDYVARPLNIYASLLSYLTRSSHYLFSVPRRFSFQLNGLPSILSRENIYFTENDKVRANCICNLGVPGVMFHFMPYQSNPGIVDSIDDILKRVLDFYYQLLPQFIKPDFPSSLWFDIWPFFDSKLFLIIIEGNIVKRVTTPAQNLESV